MKPKLKKSCYQARQEVDQGKSIAQKVLQESTGLRHIIALVCWQKGVTLWYEFFRCHKVR